MHAQLPRVMWSRVDRISRSRSGSRDEYIAGRRRPSRDVGPSDKSGMSAGAFGAVHGGIEMGGGLIHRRRSRSPSLGGQSTIEARQPAHGAERDSTKGKASAVARFKRGERARPRRVGAPRVRRWSAATAPDVRGQHGLWAVRHRLGGGSAQAVYSLMVDNNSADDGAVVTLELNDGHHRYNHRLTRRAPPRISRPACVPAIHPQRQSRRAHRASFGGARRLARHLIREGRQASP